MGYAVSLVVNGIRGGLCREWDTRSCQVSFDLRQRTPRECKDTAGTRVPPSVRCCHCTTAATISLVGTISGKGHHVSASMQGQGRAHSLCSRPGPAPGALGRREPGSRVTEAGTAQGRISRLGSGRLPSGGEQPGPSPLLHFLSAGRSVGPSDAKIRLTGRQIDGSVTARTVRC